MSLLALIEKRKKGFNQVKRMHISNSKGKPNLGLLVHSGRKAPHPLLNTHVPTAPSHSCSPSLVLAALKRRPLSPCEFCLMSTLSSQWASQSLLLQTHHSLPALRKHAVFSLTLNSSNLHSPFTSPSLRGIGLMLTLFCLVSQYYFLPTFSPWPLIASTVTNFSF